MMMGKRAALCFAVLVSLALLAVPASAGTLDGVSGALTSGSTGFSSTDETLKGFVDWAVFMPDDFTLDTGGEWTPSTGELVYLYQVFSTGTANVSKISLPVYNPVDNIGDFPDDLLTDIAPNQINVPPPGIEWLFGNPAIGQGQHSTILAYSSFNQPINSFMIAVDGGQFTIVIPVPHPGGPAIPEPATGLLVLIGMATVAMVRLPRWK